MHIRVREDVKTSYPCSGINISELGDTGWGATETGQGLPGRLKNELRHLQKPTLEPSAVTWTQEVTGWVERWIGRTWKELSFWNLKKTLFRPCGVDWGVWQEGYNSAKVPSGELCVFPQGGRECGSEHPTSELLPLLVPVLCGAAEQRQQ